MSELKRYSNLFGTSNHQYVIADEADALLAEKDKEIILWRRLANNRTDEAEAEIEKLHGNLNECTERGAEAERKVKELEEQYAQLDKDFSIAGEKDWENEDKLKEAERKMTNQAHNHSLDYAKLKKTRANLKTATDALKWICHNHGLPTIDTNIATEALEKVEPGWIFKDKKTFADIEGEMPYHHSGVSSDYTGASNKEQIHEESTWRYIEKDALEAGDFGESCQAYQGNALLWLRDKITTIEDTLSDMQAELIRKRHED